MAHRYQQEFDDFNNSNPEILEGLIDLTRRMLAAQQVRYLNSRGVWEYFRMTRVLEHGQEATKHLNNNFVPYYAREIMKAEGLAGVFRTRGTWRQRRPRTSYNRGSVSCSNSDSVRSSC